MQATACIISCFNSVTHVVPCYHLKSYLDFEKFRCSVKVPSIFDAAINSFQPINDTLASSLTQQFATENTRGFQAFVRFVSFVRFGFTINKSAPPRQAMGIFSHKHIKIARPIR